MKLCNVLDDHLLESSDKLTESDLRIIEEANTAYDNIVEMLEDVHAIREMVQEGSFPIKAIGVIHAIIDEMNAEMPMEEYEAMLEKVERQFRRYSGQDTLKRQYRCTTGSKAGRIVTSPEKCGIRKDPMKVRQGKKAARVKKGQRVRKSLFTKRKTVSKRLQRLNKAMRGDK